MAKTKARFIEPMLLLRTEKLPQGADWLYEIKLDGYRMLAIKSEETVRLRSRRDNDYTIRYKPITAAFNRCRTKPCSTARLWPSMNKVVHPSISCRTMFPQKPRSLTSSSTC